MVGFFGALGALLRYLIGIIIPSTYLMGFPLSTLVTNLMGCFGLSWFLTWVTTHPSFPQKIQTAITTGFIGSFTTFSTFNIELIQLLEKHYFFYACFYFVLSTVGGYLFCLIGYGLARPKGGVA